LEVYTEFNQKALVDYQEEFAELARLGNSLASDMKFMQSGIESGAQAVPRQELRH